MKDRLKGKDKQMKFFLSCRPGTTTLGRSSADALLHPASTGDAWDERSQADDLEIRDRHETETVVTPPPLRCCYGDDGLERPVG
jgi:hypothetical protein